MKKNMGAADKLVRLVVALLLVIAYFQDLVSGTFGIIALVVAGIFTVTSLISSCPIYSVLGMNTCPPKKN